MSETTETNAAFNLAAADTAQNTGADTISNDPYALTEKEFQEWLDVVMEAELLCG